MIDVMIVDDEPIVRLGISSLMDWRANGYDIAFEASNGKQALAVLERETRIGIVLLDLSMPVMDGIEVLEFLAVQRTRNVHVPAVLVLSAHEDFYLVRKAFTLGAVDYVLKNELDGQRLLAVMDKAAKTIRNSGADTGRNELADTEWPALKRRVLMELLESPPPPDIQTLIKSLEMRLSLPLVLCVFRINDLHNAHPAANDVSGQTDAERIVKVLSMLLERRGSGEILIASPDRIVVFFSQKTGSHDPELPPRENMSELSESARAFCEDGCEQARHYLSCSLGFTQSTPCPDFEQIAEAYVNLKPGQSGVSRIVVQAKRYLQKNFSNSELSLAELSSHLGISKNHLSWDFTKETGETITEYLARLRINEAKKLLAGSHLLVYEIADQVGYPNVEHFSRVFKRITGYSPKAWSPEMLSAGKEEKDG